VTWYLARGRQEPSACRSWWFEAFTRQNRIAASEAGALSTFATTRRSGRIFPLPTSFGLDKPNLFRLLCLLFFEACRVVIRLSQNA